MITMMINKKIRKIEHAFQEFSSMYCKLFIQVLGGGGGNLLQLVQISHESFGQMIKIVGSIYVDLEEK